MEVVSPFASPSSSLLVFSNSSKSRTLRTHHHHLSAHFKRSLNSSQVIWSSRTVSRMGLEPFGKQLRCSVSNITGKLRCCKPVKRSGQVLVCSPLFQPLRKLHSISFQCFSILRCNGIQKFVGFGVDIYKLKYWLLKLGRSVNAVFIHVVVGMMLIMSVSFTVSRSPSWALTEENLLFLEAWRTVDRAYVDKTFNGQNWFRYREDALRNEPMNTREETYMAIRKMLSTLDDPFTRFLEPEKFKSLRV